MDTSIDDSYGQKWSTAGLNCSVNSRQFGAQLEQEACAYLETQGLRLITNNFQCKLGEIDLIMCDQDETVVFVEVRYRSSKAYGGGEASVSRAKQRKLIRAASCFLQRRGWYDTRNCRFDVVAISANPKRFNWIKDAFWV